MRISPRQPEIDPRPSPHRGGRSLARNRPVLRGLARTIVGLALSAFVAHPVGAAKDKDVAKPAVSSWYTQTFLRSDAGLNVTHWWSLKSKFRAETVVNGHKLVTIVSGDTYYVYDALAMTGIAIRRAPRALAAESPDRRPFGNEAQTVIDQGGEKIREETIAGKPAAVYQITDEDGRRIVWVTQDDHRLPIRMEWFSRKTGSTRFKEYVDWINGLPVNDAFFEPEPGIQLERFELEEYIARSNAKGPASMLPVLYRELLHGPVPR